MTERRLLVIRLSAMGDAAMTIPVLKQVLHQHPNLRITVLTKEQFVSIFKLIEGIEVHSMDTRGVHKGFRGLWKVFHELRKNYAIDAVADLHNVLRSKIISFFYRSSGIRTAGIDKGRKEKKQLTAKKNKQLNSLKSSFQRYADVFDALGFPVKLNTKEIPFSRQSLPDSATPLFKNDKIKIGIAPFAKHREKTYPTEKMKEVVLNLNSQKRIQVYLLGGGKNESESLQIWEADNPGVINLAGKFSFREELAIISQFDLVVSMDSANMHLASLFGVPVVSVWGATHPFAGFYGWGQDPQNIVQTDLYCRPCSVFGNKPCYRGDHACMESISSEEITAKILALAGIPSC